jgi:Protein of unknown function (DUF4242)
MAIFLCERTFSPPLTPSQFAAGGEVLAPCLQARNVAWVASHLATDGARCICVFDAADAEAVRDANRTAGLPFDKVWPAQRFTP